MGICQTQMKPQKNKVEKKEMKDKRIKTEFTATTDPLIKQKPQQVQMSCDLLNSPPSCGQMLSLRQKTSVGLKKVTGQFSNSSRSITGNMFETSASKKYSLIQKHQTNTDISIMQSNKTGKIVEMETLSKNQANNAKYVEWLQQTKLDHPNINRMIEMHQDQNSYQIIFEHFNGSPLSQLIIDEKKLPKPVVSQILEQIMSAIHYLHSLNVVYGNLVMDSFHYQEKADGILVKLMNLKRIFFKDEDNTEVRIHTPQQLIYNSSVYNNQRDVWAIGIIGITLRKGKIPYCLEPNMSLERTQLEIKSYEFDFSKKKDLIYKDFLEQILTKWKKQQKKLDTLLSHKFIENYKVEKKKPQTILLANILTSKPCCLLQGLILSFFVQEFNWGEYIQIEKLFYEGDTDMDGFLSKTELLRLYSQYHNGEDIEEKIDQVFVNLELDHTQKINNYKFQALAASRKELLTKANIEICFGIFSNNKQEIQLRGLKRHLNYESDDLIDEFSRLTDEDRTLNLPQFTKIMEMLL